MSTDVMLTEVTPEEESAEIHAGWPQQASLDREELAALIERLEAMEAAQRPEELLELLRRVEKNLRGSVSLVVAPVPSREETRGQREDLIDRMVPDIGVPSESSVLQARRNAEARTQLLQEFGALTGEQIAEERSKAQNRHALAARWRKEGRIFGVPYRGQTVYPAFQFAPTGELRGVVQDVLATLPADRMTEWEVALWWTATNGWLGGKRPVDLVETDPGALIDAAAHLAGPSPL